MVWIAVLEFIGIIALGAKLMEVLGALGRLQMMIDTIPMVWTTKGNKFQGEVEYACYWTEDDNATTFVEEYKLEDEIIKRNVHVRSKKGVEAISLVNQT